jgi:hypothetical protein
MTFVPASQNKVTLHVPPAGIVFLIVFVPQLLQK